MHTHHSHSSDHCHCAVPSTPEQVRALRIALVMVASFSVAELWVSVHSNSLSLMADAGHMVTDVFAIAFSLWTALQVAQSAADSATQIKNERLNALAALTNGGLLLVVSGWLAWEAIGELRSPPPEILSSPVAITAAIGLCVNGINAYLLHSHAADNLNLRGAFLHMVADASSCLGVLVGAVLIAQFGWYRADGIVSGAIALLILTTALPLIRQSWAVLNIFAAKTPSETI
ncbi:MAG: RND-type cobalt-zinc-cadmium efflux pump associated metal detoxification protein CzcD [Phormidesmis priestleyi Ana]|uniref:RND-type cobalt-zinc-cadmium efflux pump associated metal detoxification protein CzcD n=1 Tax=Phormidesmis priestleyi Ana TaxID=1666911 RepID=A0A0N8KNE4_9CYAN|nr:MAG: RND-type cobalt-zinc-cadmium efflux pump associated metal detoxification protein CzcD [Phormidesmis priestleyi Ana]